MNCALISKTVFRIKIGLTVAEILIAHILKMWAINISATRGPNLILKKFLEMSLSDDFVHKVNNLTN